LPDDLAVGSFVDVVVTGADGPDLVAELVPRTGPAAGRRMPASTGAAP
jgi:hypothetical protein